jgi:hypothetical protein
LIAYKSASDTIADVLANRVQIRFTTMATGVPLAKAGKVRVLGAAGKERASVLPDKTTWLFSRHVAQPAYVLWEVVCTPEPSGARYRGLKNRRTLLRR